MTENATRPTVEFAPGGPERFRAVPLTYPLLVDGEPLNSVTVRRLKGHEVRELQEGVDDAGLNFDKMIQSFTDQPQYVLDALDQDDFAEVAETVIDFLPVKLRNEMENARAQLEEMLQQRMQEEAGGQSDLSPLGAQSSPTSRMPSNGANETS
ncbi:phage tail assembly protein [Cognatishimia sp. MH4019]|uniref:phage tail assembly protein n=1 Tax=Cognatishimia sp. MH4019 TaxID=2854030 RepID=UPI001CD5C949|nr:phage tail assembly protein [Cognatishimia sp. MH4019]